MPQSISKDTPLQELTLRRYEKPKVNDRSLVRKFCLSVGMLQPGDSRDVVVDVLYVLLKAKQQNELLHSEEIKNRVMELRKSQKLPMLGIASSNIRRQLKRLKNIYLVDGSANTYRIAEFALVQELMKEKVDTLLYQSIISRVHEYAQKIDEEFK